MTLASAQYANEVGKFLAFNGTFSTSSIILCLWINDILKP